MTYTVQLLKSLRRLISLMIGSLKMRLEDIWMELLQKNAETCIKRSGTKNKIRVIKLQSLRKNYLMIT